MTTRVPVLLTACALWCGCTSSPTGRLCQPDEENACGDGYQCLTFCEAGTDPPQSICAPAFGAERRGVYKDVAVVDGRTAFGELANVREIQQGLRVELKGLKGVAFPLLEKVTGDLTLINTDVLECLYLPRLSEVTGVLTVDSNDALQRIVVPSLTSVGELVVTDNAAVKVLELNALRHIAGSGTIEDNDTIAKVDMERLEDVGASDRLLVRRGDPNRALPETSLDNFRGGCIAIEQMDSESPCPSGDGTSCTRDVLPAGVQSCCVCVDDATQTCTTQTGANCAF